MDIRRELRRRIERKHVEIKEWRAELHELETKIREGTAYIAGLEDTMKLLPMDVVADAANSTLRPDSAIAKAREVILKAGKPLHIIEILKALGKPTDHDSKASLSGSIGAYVRNKEIFTRPAPNTFGLMELQVDPKSAAEDDIPSNFGEMNGVHGDAE